MTIQAQEMRAVLQQLFEEYDILAEKAAILAEVHTDNTLHGVNSHGINRVPRFIRYVKNGVIKVDAEAEKAEGMGSIERWDGMAGPGVLNAIKCTDRAVELAEQNGMGLVALRNTNHWMRGGYYGWRAARKGCIAIMFTNTQPNMPAWGGQESRIGNNPLIVSIPREKGHVVLDMALSQYAFGKVDEYRRKGEQLPHPGGFDADHQLTTDPAKILATERALPIGYWKGSALSMVLDMLATLLAAGNSSGKVWQGEYETGLSQIYLCIKPGVFADTDLQQRLVDEIIDFTHSATPTRQGGQTYYPGERSLEAFKRNSAEGMEVDDGVWRDVLGLMKS